MKGTMLACCKYVILGAAAIPFVVIAVALFPILNWHWWVGMFLPLIVLPVWGGAVLLKKLLLRMSERRSAQPAGEDGAPGKKFAEEGQNRLDELHGSWKKAVETLRASHLKKEGDPLYVLPWYLVMGESGSGKSTAIKSARLSSPFADDAGSAGGTRGCDWRFYDQGILIDTAGRYAMPADPVRDNEEWRELISLLLKYRRREPINGLIVTVAADKLAKGPAQDLENDGRQLRSRIDELMLELGITFPVYVLVTKCDLIRGMTRFCAGLPEKSLEQPMGLVNEGTSTDLSAFLERFSRSMDERLASLRLRLLHRRESGPASGDLLLFPDEIRHLMPSLDAFMLAAFGQNHYQETPLLRGIHLCSAQQQGMPRSCLPAELRPIGEQEPPPGAGRGLFLHDFFEKVLPRDRGLLAPTARTMKWNALAGRVALMSWLLIGASLCVLLSYSFMKNLAVIREASALVAETPELRGGPAANLAAMDRMGRMISNVEQRNLNWGTPRLGLNRSRQIEQALKARYCSQFRDRFLVFHDRNLAKTIGGFSRATPDHLFGSHIVHLSRRTNLLKSRLESDRLDELASLPLPDHLDSALRLDGDSEPSFGLLYLNYAAWRSDRGELGQEVRQLQSMLKQAFALKGTSLDWLLEFADRDEPHAAVSLQEFWGGTLPLREEPAIAPAFTGKGKECVTALVREISAAYPEQGVLELEKGDFEIRYRNACLAAWQKFARQLSKGEQRLIAPKEWRRAAADMAGEQGPYYSFMRRAAVELEPFVSGAAEMPIWLMQLYGFQLLNSIGPEAGVASSAGKKGEGIADKLGRLIGKRTTPLAGVSSADVAREYLGAVARIAPVAKSRSMAHQMALEAFSEPPGGSKSPLFQAADAAQRLNALLAQGGTDDTFSSLITGPITFYGTFVRMETACSLQAHWEEKVLKEVQGTSNPQTLQYLLDKDGPVWKFVGAFADPFIGWSPGRGYYSKSALGGSVPFKPEFYAFLAKGAKAKIAAAATNKASYQMTIKGLPTDANSEARVKPQSTRLELQCATGSQVITNMNYPVSRPFAWSPGVCGDVLFQIDIGDVVLTRKYTGARAFPDFLRDFPGGRHTFYPGQFPAEKRALETMGIEFIRVKYQMFGADEIASGQADELPSRVPAKITECWD